MKNKIFKKIKRIFSGVITALGSILLFIILAVIYISAFSGHKTLPENMILKLTLEGELNETDAGSGFPFDLMSGPGSSSGSVHGISDFLRTASSDSRVKGLILNVKDGDYGYAHIQEVRNAVADFKRSGKTVYVYGNAFGNPGSGMASYYLASVGDEIWLPPMGSVGITGFYTGSPFFKGLFDIVGIIPEMIHKGDYKSAPESLMRKDMSPENREMMQSVIDGYYNSFITDVSASRKIGREMLQEAVDNAPLSSGEALKLKLIDKIGYKDMFIEEVTAKIGDFEWIDVADYYSEEETADDKYIAVVHVDGLITETPGEGAVLGENSIDLQDITASLEDVSEDKNCAAIVMRINSPGGTPEASDELHRAVGKAGEKKPVIVSMGNAAASGGYWVAVNSSYITALPMTLTGSIGVFGGKISVKGLLDKVGISVDGVRIGKNSDMYYPDRQYTPEQRKKIGGMMDDIYSVFIDRVAAGRKMPVERIGELAKGRVYTGEQAVKLGLVDEIGGLGRAVDKAAETAGLKTGKNTRTVHLPGPRSFFDKINDFADETGFIYAIIMMIKTTGLQAFGVNASVVENNKIY